MAPKQDQVIRLLLVEDSAEDAEQVVSQLRNAGLAVRPTRAENREHLTNQLAEQPIDLVLASAKSKAVSLSEVAAAVQQSGKDRSVIAILASITDDLAVKLQKDGVRAFALRGHPDHLQAVVRREFEDLSNRRGLRKLEASLKESERRCEALLDSSRDPITFVHEGMHVRANKAYLEMFGVVDFEDIEGTPILDMIAPAAADSFKALLKKLSKGEKPPAKLEIQAQKPDGGTFDAVMEFAEATFEGEPCQQITFRQQVAVDAEAIKELRDKDLVTGLYNRSFILAELDRVVTEAADGRHDMALALLEPDNFKTVVDTVGLGSTDLLLADMAALVREHVGADDAAGRFSDNAFAILYRRHSHEETLKRAHALRKAFEDRIFEAGGKSLPVPVSIGMTLIGEKIANADAILGNAASSLKAVQAAGGNQVKAFDPAAQDKADAEAERGRLQAIQDALKNNGFVLFYQPIISLHGAEGEFYEILLRMLGPKGEIMPAEFFPIAEKYNLLPAIDRWVIANAIKSLAERERTGHKTTFFVKVTVPSLEDPAMLPWVAQHLKSNRVSGDKVVFEMPESKVSTNLNPVRQFLKGLAQLHCGFAVQQFGSGLNSFQLLKHIDLRYLKIDRTFMTEFAKSKENQQRVKEICDQAHGNGKLTIAEFVEDAASMSILFTLGVNFVQGNFLQEPEKVMAYEFG
jgi:diguanylate cyclase (GGDEF)-like protein/PAS domain S-box-containing protein